MGKKQEVYFNVVMELANNDNFHKWINDSNEIDLRDFDFNEVLVKKAISYVLNTDRFAYNINKYVVSITKLKLNLCSPHNPAFRKLVNGGVNLICSILHVSYELALRLYIVVRHEYVNYIERRAKDDLRCKPICDTLHEAVGILDNFSTTKSIKTHILRSRSENPGLGLVSGMHYDDHLERTEDWIKLNLIKVCFNEPYAEEIHKYILLDSSRLKQLADDLCMAYVGVTKGVGEYAYMRMKLIIDVFTRVYRNTVPHSRCKYNAERLFFKLFFMYWYDFDGMSIERPTLKNIERARKILEAVIDKKRYRETRKAIVDEYGSKILYSAHNIFTSDLLAWILVCYIHDIKNNRSSMLNHMLAERIFAYYFNDKPCKYGILINILKDVLFIGEEEPELEIKEDVFASVDDDTDFDVPDDEPVDVDEDDETIEDKEIKSDDCEKYILPEDITRNVTYDEVNEAMAWINKNLDRDEFKEDCNGDAVHGATMYRDGVDTILSQEFARRFVERLIASMVGRCSDVANVDEIVTWGMERPISLLTCSLDGNRRLAVMTCHPMGSEFREYIEKAPKLKAMFTTSVVNARNSAACRNVTVDDE